MPPVEGGPDFGAGVRSSARKSVSSAPILMAISPEGSNDRPSSLSPHVVPESRGFRIEYYYICIERAEGMRLGIFFQMRITLTDACRSVFENICLSDDSAVSFVFHSAKTII